MRINDLPRINAAVDTRVNELGGETFLTIPTGHREDHDFGIVVWRRIEDDSFITHRFDVDRHNVAHLENGDYGTPGRETAHEAIRRGCKRGAGLTR